MNEDADISDFTEVNLSVPLFVLYFPFIIWGPEVNSVPTLVQG